MKERLTTYERREGIRLLLVKEKSTTTKILMDKYGVSKQTILNDIVFLSSVMPIETRPGNCGGIFLKMEYDSPKSYLTNDEESLLLRLLDDLSEKDKRMLINVINKFSKPSES